MEPASGPPVDPLRLFTPAGIRERTRKMFELGLVGALDHVRVDLARLHSAAELLGAAYDSAAHEWRGNAIWRRLEAGGLERWRSLIDRPVEPMERARAGADLAVVTAVLGGEPGPDWAYADGDTVEALRRQDGLAVAAYHLFRRGAFSARPQEPCRVDAAALSALAIDILADGLQHSRVNELAGLELRHGLIADLGRALLERPDIFGEEARAGALIDRLVGRGGGPPKVTSDDLLALVLPVFAPLVPGGPERAGLALGDAYEHPRLAPAFAADPIVPLHAMAAEIAASLVEPLAWAGIEVAKPAAFVPAADRFMAQTLLDLGILRLRDPGAAAQKHSRRSRLVGEVRAVAVAAVDRLLEIVRRQRSISAAAASVPLFVERALVPVGRRLRTEKAAEGAPALCILADGAP